MFEEQPLLKTRYTFESGTGNLEDDRYITHINGEILAILIDEEANESFMPIGKFELKLVHITLAINTNYPIFDICDSSMDMRAMMFPIWDMETAELVPEIQEALGDDIGITTNDILIINKIQIVKKYRGLGLAPKVLKDIYMRFEDAVSLFVLEAFPLQINEERVKYWSEQEKEFYAKMDYQSFTGNEKKNTKKIMNMYKSIGFIHIPLEKTDGIFMFSATCLNNRKLRKLKMD